jgi:hypothetical protein
MIVQFKEAWASNSGPLFVSGNLWFGHVSAEFAQRRIQLRFSDDDFVQVLFYIRDTHSPAEGEAIQKKKKYQREVLFHGARRAVFGPAPVFGADKRRSKRPL